MEVLREVPTNQTSPPLHELREWKTRYGLTVGVSSRGGGSDDFGLAGVVPAVDIFQRWLALPLVVGGTFPQMCTGRQIHGTTIRRHEGSQTVGQWVLQDGVDGHLTGDDGVLLTVTVADCVPAFLFATDTGDIGLLHAGWRGVAGGILEKGIEGMTAAGAKAQNIALHLGPAICGNCYEVGSEVAEQLGQAGHERRRVDLRAVLAEKATKIGLKRITISTWCTKHDAVFHSFRRDGSESGRMVAYLGRSNLGFVM